MSIVSILWSLVSIKTIAGAVIGSVATVVVPKFFTTVKGWVTSAKALEAKVVTTVKADVANTVNKIL